MGCCFDTYQERFHRKSFYLIIPKEIYYRKRNAEEQYGNRTQAFPKGKPSPTQRIESTKKKSVKNLPIPFFIL